MGLIAPPLILIDINGSKWRLMGINNYKSQLLSGNSRSLLITLILYLK